MRAAARLLVQDLDARYRADLAPRARQAGALLSKLISPPASLAPRARQVGESLSKLLSAPASKTPAHDSLNRQIRAAMILAGVLVFGIGGWACFTSLSGAVIAPGQIVVQSEIKKVQHPVGGVVAALLVHEGDRVKTGQLLVRLDETQIRANLDIILKSLDELTARRTRDEAERQGAEQLSFPAEFLARAKTDATVAHLIEGETAYFTTRLAARNGQKSQLGERIAQLRQEVIGLENQAGAKDREMVLIQDELQGLRELRQKNLVPLSRLTTLEREAARLVGERGQLLASTAQAKGKISETELQVMQLDQDMRSEVAKDLADIRAKTSETVEKRVVAEDQLRHVDLRAPQDGVVHQMSVHTIGGLVTPAEPVMLIVPQADNLAVEVKIQPQDIDHVHAGQLTGLRFSAFNQRTTPEVRGIVDRVSPDVTHDGKTGMSFYTARIAIPDAERQRLGRVSLIPGMPVETFIQTAKRTVLSYLTKPLTDQVAKAWREN